MKIYIILLSLSIATNISIAQSSIMGVLLNEKTGNPISNARVYILGGDSHEKTTTFGEYKLNLSKEDLAKGLIEVYIYHKDYGFYKSIVEIPKNLTFGLETSISLDNVKRIHGTVLEDDTKNPIKEIEVVLIVEEDLRTREHVIEKTDKYGGYSFLIDISLIGCQNYAQFKFSDSLKRYDYKDGILDIRTHQKTYLDKNETKIINENTIKPVSPQMILIQGGSFYMGKTSNEKAQFTPKIAVGAYYMGKYEITVKEFSEFIKASGYKTEAERGCGSYIWNGRAWKCKKDVNWRYDVKGNLRTQSDNNHPVIHITWKDAIHYCNWLSQQLKLEQVYTISDDAITANPEANGYRLPTEAEWEFAARSGGKDYTYSWGNDNIQGNLLDLSAQPHFDWAKIVANHNDAYPFTAPVYEFPQGVLGLHNMSGNVWEWCWTMQNIGSNIQNVNNGKYGTRRGGGWDSDLEDLMSIMRSEKGAKYRSQNTGFRLARTKVD